MKTPKIKYTTLFDYALKYYLLDDGAWNRCHEIFFKTNLLVFQGISETFYEQDLDDELNDEIFPPDYTTPYAIGMKIIHNFMLDKSYSEVKFY